MFNFPWIRKPNYPKLARLDYDDYWKSRGFVIKDKLKERESILLAEIPSGSKILDIGCGNSYLPIALKAKGCNVTVGDVSSVVLEGFKKYNVDTMTVNLTHVEGMKEIPTGFDYIILSEVLEHLPNPEEVIMTLTPLTKRFAITIPNSAYYWFRFGLTFKGRFFTQWVHHPSEHLRFWSHIDFLDWLKALDLHTTKFFASNGRRPLKDLWPNLFGFQMVYLVETE